MKINENVCIRGNKTVLVPYENYHVQKYHLWMQSKELQDLTASEPLSLEEEYEMQKSWRRDEDKCTFIVLDADLYDKTANEIDSMIGDTNMFIDVDNKQNAEIEIMIAERDARGKGFGKEAVTLMMIYGIKYLNIKTFFAKISTKNTPSISLFKKLGYSEYETSVVFQEETLIRTVDKVWCAFLESICKMSVLEHIKK